MKNLLKPFLQIAITLLAVAPCVAANDANYLSKYILTPKPSAEPRINGPKVFGVRPGHPLLFTIPTTGKRPIDFSAQNLPQGVELDEKKGRLTGQVHTPGTYQIELKAQNKLGFDTSTLTLEVGEKIALTPPMGWNSWNCWAREVSAQKVRKSAKAMVDSGLINHGWTYINIDDAWQGKRGGKYNAIQPNEKFPDMKELCDYVHSLGLKIGIYSTPWTTSYAGFVGGSANNADGSWEMPSGDRRGKFHGKYKFDSNDAEQWSQWGIDYLKYDWRPNDLPTVKRMAYALRYCGRDIVYSLSNSALFQNAAEYAKWANCWRTTGDIRDTWLHNDLAPDWAKSITDILRLHSKWAWHNGPGHYNDPDMLVVGKVGWGNLRPTHLTPYEQYSHISLWALWSAPMLLGCPLEGLDDFTLNLLTNDEVIAINQDPLCNQARLIFKQGPFEVWSKKLEDGSVAAGMFNLDEKERKYGIRFDVLSLPENQKVRDLWRQKDLGTFQSSFHSDIPPHGVMLIKLTPASR